MSKERVSTTIADRWSYLWLAIGTLLGFFWTIPLVMWLAPIFTLRFMRTQKVWRGSLLLWLTSFVAFTITLRDILGAFFPLPVYVVTMAVTALLVGTLPYLADRLLWHRLPGFTATLVLPLAVTAVDFISATTSPMGSIGAQAYLQYGNLPLMQLLAITGMWGITFLVNWFGAVVNWASERSCAWPEIRRGVAIYAGIMLVVLLYGSVRVTFAPPLTGTVRVHGITEVDMRQNWGALNQLTERDGWQAMRKKTAEYRDVYLAATEREAKAGAQIVVWPEMALMVAGEDEPELIARAQKIAREHGIYLAMAVGTRYEDRRPWENKLIVLDPAGQVVLEHYKYGGAAMEGTRPGDAVLRTVETPFGTLSGIICWDTDFPAPSPRPAATAPTSCCRPAWTIAP
jgi:apolipoprotein N-acyltransferase